MGRRTTSAVCALALLAAPSDAVSDPVRFPDGGRCEAPSGASITLVQGAIVLSAEDWAKLDTEVMRLQATEVRLEAQNKVLRQEPSKLSLATTILAIAVVAFGAGYAKGAL